MKHIGVGLVVPETGPGKIRRWRIQATRTYSIPAPSRTVTYGTVQSIDFFSHVQTDGPDPMRGCGEGEQKSRRAKPPEKYPFFSMNAAEHFCPQPPIHSFKAFVVCSEISVADILSPVNRARFAAHWITIHESLPLLHPYPLWISKSTASTAHHDESGFVLLR